MTREELRAWAAKTVAKWPPPTADQRDRLAAMFAPAREANALPPVVRKAA
ncbi:MAG TPA: hypothetical protein VFG15_27520 [Amycolatopsis sp.]|nr:hypothetical protein [Amycolatopsis sp.]